MIVRLVKSQSREALETSNDLPRQCCASSRFQDTSLSELRSVGIHGLGMVTEIEALKWYDMVQNN